MQASLLRCLGSDHDVRHNRQVRCLYVSLGRPPGMASVPLYSDDEDRAGLVLFLGSDTHGVPLEVAGIEIADDDLLIIHAMRLRASNLDDL